MCGPAAEGRKCVYPESKSCAHRLRYTLNIRGNSAHAECTTFKIVHPALKSCTQGSGCTLNFKHCTYRIKIQVLDVIHQSDMQYSMCIKVDQVNLIFTTASQLKAYHMIKPFILS